MGRGLRILGGMLLVLGLAAALGAVVVRGEVATHCATQEAQFGTLLGHPEAEKCRTYPAYADMGMWAGLVVGLLGVAFVALPPRA